MICEHNQRFKRIRKIERLVDQGKRGSPAYVFSKYIAPEKAKPVVGVVIVGNTCRKISEWCNPSKAPPST